MFWNKVSFLTTANSSPENRKEQIVLEGIFRLLAQEIELHLAMVTNLKTEISSVRKYMLECCKDNKTAVSDIRFKVKTDVSLTVQDA